MERQGLLVALLLVLTAAGFAQSGDDDVMTDVITTTPEAAGAIILGVEGQDAKNKQDDGTIVKDIDLGDGRKMKIVITSGHGKREKTDAKRWTTTFGTMRDDGAAVVGPRVRAFTPSLRRVDPHGFDIDVLRGEVEDHMKRALEAFDKAREEFVRVYEGRAEKRKAPLEVAPKSAAEGRATAPNARVKVERKEKKDDGDVKVLRVGPGAAGQNAREIEAMRGEIEELRKMVGELREQLGKKD